MPELSKPRSVRAHDAMLAATRSLLADGGSRAATVDAISARSGVSKAAIGNHWPSRAAIAAEAFGAEMAQATPPPDTGSARCPEIDAELAQDVLVGPLIFRLVTGHGPIDSEAAQRIAAAALDGLMR